MSGFTIYVPDNSIIDGATMHSKDAEHLKLAVKCRVYFDGNEVSGSVFAFKVQSNPRLMRLECKDVRLDDSRRIYLSGHDITSSTQHIRAFEHDGMQRFNIDTPEFEVYLQSLHEQTAT